MVSQRSVGTIIALALCLAHYVRASYLEAPELLTRGNRLRNTVRAPLTCRCKKMETLRIGKCYFYKNEVTKSCSYRPCKPSYICAYGGTMLCLRRKIIKKIVPVYPQTCKTIKVGGFMYVPYSRVPNALPKLNSGATTQSFKPTYPGSNTFADQLKAKEEEERNTAIAVLEEKAKKLREIGRRKRLEAERKRKAKRRRELERRQRQAEKRRERIRRKKAKKEILRELKAEAKDSYMPVVGHKVLGNYATVSEAEKPLLPFLPKANLIYAIFRVHHLEILTMPLPISRYWKTPADAKVMFKACKAYNKKRVKKLVDRRYKWYIVVIGGKTRRYRSYKAAKRALRKLPKKSRKRRAIFRVVAGKMESKPLKKGNWFWRSRNAKGKLIKTAKKYMKRLRKWQTKKAKPAPKPKSSPKPKAGKPKPKEKKKSRFYVVVIKNKVRRYRTLKAAVKSLGKVPSSSKTRRAIFLVKGGRMRRRPYKKGNYYWSGPAVEKKLYLKAAAYLVRLKKYLMKKHGTKVAKTTKKETTTKTTTTTTMTATTPKTTTTKKVSMGKIDYYIVTADKTAFGEYETLESAKHMLARFPPESRRGRAIFAVIEGEVQPNPLNAGNKFWRFKSEVERMYKTAKDYNDKVSKIVGTPLRDAYGTFIVVSELKIFGKYDKLSDAKNVLMKEFKKTSVQSRVIFEVKNGEIVQDPHIIAGQNQGSGLRRGFNKFWWGKEDIARLYKKANIWWEANKY